MTQQQICGDVQYSSAIERHEQRMPLMNILCCFQNNCLQFLQSVSELIDTPYFNIMLYCVQSVISPAKVAVLSSQDYHSLVWYGMVYLFLIDSTM